MSGVNGLLEVAIFHPDEAIAANRAMATGRSGQDSHGIGKVFGSPAKGWRGKSEDAAHVRKLYRLLLSVPDEAKVQLLIGRQGLFNAEVFLNALPGEGAQLTPSCLSA